MIQVISTKGQKQVAQAVSAEGGSLVTMVGIINAGGVSLPPIYVFPRIKNNPAFIKHGPQGCVCVAFFSKTGWMTGDLFLDVLKHIVTHTNCTKDKPILLVLGNHSSHGSLETILFCRNNGIHVLSFPPHTSHRLQPLDVAVYGPFKKFCNNSLNNYHINNPGKKITIYDIAELSKQPFLKAFSQENIIKSFKVTGISPFNDMIFSDADFSTVSPHVSGDNSTDNSSSTTIILQTNTPALPTVNVPTITSIIPTGNVQTTSSTQLTPEQVRPFLNSINKNYNRQTQSSRIYTDSPEKKTS